MKIKHKLTPILICAVTLVAASVVKTYALDPSQLQLNKNLLQNLKPAWPITCKNIDKLIDKRLANFEEKETNHYENYIKLKDRLSEKITRWKNLGYNVSDLEDDLKNLEEKIDKFYTDYNAFRNKLEELKNFTCASTVEDYKTKLAEAKALLKPIKADAAEIRKYYQTTIRPDILALKNQVITGED